MITGAGTHRQKYVLEPLSDGGVLLDLDSGALFELNVSAAFVWSHAVNGVRSSEIAAAYAQTYGVDQAIAQADVAATLNAQQDYPPQPKAETHYEFLGDRYRFWVAGAPEFEILAAGQSIRCLRQATPTEIYRLLRPLSPKLLALLGTPVLHASAVQGSGGGVIAFLGVSGAGKTTTARAFRTAGFNLLSEDKVVLRRVESGIAVISQGEKNIDVWVRGAALRLAALPPGEWCELGGLHEAAMGESAPLDQVILLDPDRRSGSDLHLTPLGPSAATTSVFRNGFYGSYSASDWSRSLSIAIAVARSALVVAANVPNGTAALQEGVLRYVEITQS